MHAGGAGGAGILGENMSQNPKSNVTLNRVVAFLAGAALVFLVMNFSVLGASKAKVAELQKQLDSSQFEAGRMLADAKALAASKDNKKAEEVLDSLFVQRPGSAEATEGKILYDSLIAADKKLNDRWELAVVGIRQKWALAEGSKLREQFNSGLSASLDQEWEKVKDQQRADWEKS